MDRERTAGTELQDFAHRTSPATYWTKSSHLRMNYSMLRRENPNMTKNMRR